MTNTPNQFWTHLEHADFWRTAQVNCALVDHYRPELIISLAHGGMLSVKVTEAAWHVMTDRAFPPVLYTNLGREKLRYYEKWREAQGMPRHFHGDSSGLNNILHFMDWLRSREDWLDELSHQVEATLGEGVEPGMIMVIDEMAAEGNTLLLTLGLLEILYPMAETHFVDGPYFQWREVLGSRWLKERHPDVLAQISDAETREAGAAQYNLFKIMSGTEDIDPVSLSFRPLSHENESVRQLSKYLPMEEWLAIPNQAERAVLDEIRQLAGIRTVDEARSIVNWEYVRRVNRLAPYRLIRHIRQWGQITLAEAARTLGVEENEVRGVMQDVMWHARYEARQGKAQEVDFSPTRSGLTYYFVEEPEWYEPPARESKAQRLKAKRRDPRPMRRSYD